MLPDAAHRSRHKPHQRTGLGLAAHEPVLLRHVRRLQRRDARRQRRLPPLVLRLRRRRLSPCCIAVFLVVVRWQLGIIIALRRGILVSLSAIVFCGGSTTRVLALHNGL